ncbi:hypothetical protein TrLO_g3752 [Triparma laevis f. longispina]|uniref:Uncharacterized protein n=1 Tax=Triparma laevis f. longispina TaxID=1714387 RepID=A0A9W7AJ82_9STRA|nr:hypothetical protein TrLO_g3752 [Triparma laevis f. longispina]
MTEDSALLTGSTPVAFGFLPLTSTCAWLLLFTAITAEVLGTSCMKSSAGFTNTLPSIGIFIFYGISFTLLPVVMRVIDLSITYAIWSGLGTFGTALIGFGYFGEKVTALKVGGIAIILVGVAMLKYAEGLDHKYDDVDAGEDGNRMMMKL